MRTNRSNGRDDHFPHGAVMFFRMATQDGSLSRSVLPLARRIQLDGQDYVVTDIEGRHLGYFPRDFIAAVLPIEPVPEQPQPMPQPQPQGPQPQ